ncbi:MAG: PIN domain-containing protein [bacterium]|nr:PIN domain-containing protein [bacterium]
MTKNVKKVVVDTDVWVGLANRNDAHHEACLAVMRKFEKEGVHLITSNYVFAETITVVSRLAGKEAAWKLAMKIRQAGTGLEYVWIDEELEGKALEHFKRQTSKNVSLVDCSNMAVIEKWGADGILSFDKAYRKNGFAMLT